MKQFVAAMGRLAVDSESIKRSADAYGILMDARGKFGADTLWSYPREDQAQYVLQAAAQHDDFSDLIADAGYDDESSRERAILALAKRRLTERLTALASAHGMTPYNACVNSALLRQWAKAHPEEKAERGQAIRDSFERLEEAKKQRDAHPGEADHQENYEQAEADHQMLGETKGLKRYYLILRDSEGNMVGRPIPYYDTRGPEAFSESTAPGYRDVISRHGHLLLGENWDTITVCHDKAFLAELHFAFVELHPFDKENRFDYVVGRLEGVGAAKLLDEVSRENFQAGIQGQLEAEVSQLCREGVKAKVNLGVSAVVCLGAIGAAVYVKYANVLASSPQGQTALVAGLSVLAVVAAIYLLVSICRSDLCRKRAKIIDQTKVMARRESANMQDAPMSRLFGEDIYNFYRRMNGQACRVAPQKTVVASEEGRMTLVC